MNKAEFTQQLTNSLVGLSEEDLKRSVDYYTEMIDDRIEDGMSEEEAVSALGSIDEIRSKILEDVPIAKIVLLVLGAPIWLPLLLTAIILCLTIYLVFWVIILSLYIVVFAVFISGIAGIIAAFLQSGGFLGGLFFCGSAVTLIGLSILLFFGFNQVTKGMIYISKKIVLGIKKLFVGGNKNEA